MLFILYTARRCRSLKCLPSSKVLGTMYSAGVAKPTPSAEHTPAEREGPCLTVGKRHRCHTILTSISVAPNASAPNSMADMLPKFQEVVTSSSVKPKTKPVQEPEWRHMEVDTSKFPTHCLMLSKIRLTSLVVITTMGGYALAPAAFDIQTFLLCSIGTGLVSATANSINQFLEIPFDAQMSRTKNRVLVRGHLTPAYAIAFATVSGVAGLSMLYLGVNGLTAALGATNLILYTLIYTPMKRVSILNTWVGSIVGAIPPLMGWAGCAGNITAPGAWIMSGMLYAWQFPHFNALSWNLRPDYSRAGYRMMAVTNPGLCRRVALRYTAAIMGLSYLAPALDVTSWWFAVESTPLNAYFLYLAWQFYKESDSASSRKLFRFSLIHLPALMLLMLFNKKSLRNTTDTTNSVSTNGEKDPQSYFAVLGKPTTLKASTV
ncbi:protoheme IX farnesyltransferase, mitochondrial isoform X1 [Neodiprion pinetum]|uniref:Protoheme IX farnesyltransferase, mitochondrial n=2 Tax=Neodiprion lecontei TaxID=441921 RepID=A0A6J0CC29_NEOLC|nr:protoheme IX farnesyltransferase, mitochondrial isoform X1 [Neodiprion lecontei]XP_015523993.1 protoheme IX farnesyltransferase, mitochondrial isoform X1 [Neodiprion lecontei]XP_015524001.1 protoheme IX farnesyltransferase, mitochondrial isoform X1 [Neodiprion lecontei]XP_046477227.1 protoheme IX farnesyltransferase, mitochondrial isoform X1 [Neodiprion pinetum]XP_046477228.1 protoheme IX farnesyltransferase, mitochondrial isoform X1 [Neodiprion pinetum]XP_046477229.1 protoheme IX farnesylt